MMCEYPYSQVLYVGPGSGWQEPIVVYCARPHRAHQVGKVVLAIGDEANTWCVSGKVS